MIVIQCGNFTSQYTEDAKIILCPDSIGCSTLNNGDFYDAGFTHEMLRRHDVIITIGTAKIVIESQLTKETRLLNQFQAEFKVSESAARYFLTKEKWNYGMAALNLKFRRKEGCIPKPCGEILLGGPAEVCNLTEVLPSEETLKLIFDAKRRHIGVGIQSLDEVIMVQTESGFIRPEAYEQLKAWVNSPLPPDKANFIQVSGNKEAKPSDEVPDLFAQAMPKTAAFQELDRLNRVPNPCADIPIPKLNWDCICGNIGKRSCRVHNNPYYGELHPDAIRILKGESTGHFCWNFPILSSTWWEVKPGWPEPKEMIGGKTSND